MKFLKIIFSKVFDIIRLDPFITLKKFVFDKWFILKLSNVFLDGWMDGWIDGCNQSKTRFRALVKAAITHLIFTKWGQFFNFFTP
jgi:hypothetical protein